MFLRIILVCNFIRLIPINVHNVIETYISFETSVHLDKILIPCLSILYLCTYFLSAMYLTLVCAFLYHFHFLISSLHKADFKNISEKILYKY